jgi:hypothetical protein
MPLHAAAPPVASNARRLAIVDTAFATEHGTRVGEACLDGITGGWASELQADASLS